MKQKQIFTFRDAEKQVAPAAFSIMLKPAGSACNLDCHYCYYLDKAVQYGGRQAIHCGRCIQKCLGQEPCPAPGRKQLPVEFFGFLGAAVFIHGKKGQLGKSFFQLPVHGL